MTLGQTSIVTIVRFELYILIDGLVSGWLPGELVCKHQSQHFTISHAAHASTNAVMLPVCPDDDISNRKAECVFLLNHNGDRWTLLLFVPKIDVGALVPW